MVLYRITRCIYNNLSGAGAKQYGGRWNSEGRAMVYLASSRSLAVLESLAHITATNVPLDYCIMTIEAPENFTQPDVSLLPANWNDFPDQNLLKQVGNQFLADNKYLFLKVPSVIVKEEFNFLMNPMHQEAALTKILSTQPFYFDERLVRR